MATIFHQVVIEAGKNRIYDAITLQSGLSQWWMADCTVKPEVGFVNLFRMEGHGTNKMKVFDLQHCRRVEWECCNDDHPWTGTRIIFEIAEKKDACVLSFKHAGWKEQTDFFGTCSFHWARHLLMLAHLCETGKSQLDRQKERAEVRKVTTD